MGRIRSIKPDFFLDEDLAAHPPLTRLLFAGLWTLSDCEGRLEDRPARIKIQILPYDEHDVDAALDALASTGQVIRYEVGGRRYMQVVNFRRHQRLTGKEAMSESTLPGPEDGFPVEGKQPGSFGETADVQEGKGREGKGKEKGNGNRKRDVSLSPLKSQEAQDAFDRVHSAWPVKRPVDGKPAKGDRVPAERNFQRILDAGKATVGELEAAAHLYLTHHPRVQGGYVVMISTFYGDEKGLWAEAVRTIRERRGKEGGVPA